MDYNDIHGVGSISVDSKNMATIVTEDGETRYKQYPVHWPRERVWDAIRREMALLGGEFVGGEES